MMKKRIISFLCVLTLITSLATPAFATHITVSDEPISATNQTNVTVDELLHFIYDRGGRIASEEEMQQISDKVNEVNDLYFEAAKQERGLMTAQLKAEIAAVNNELDALPSVTVTYQDLVDLGFISAAVVAPVPPSPSDTRYVTFKLSTSAPERNNMTYYYTRINAVNAFSSSSLVNAPLYFHSQSILFDDSDNVDSLVANGTKFLLEGALMTSDVSIPILGPDTLLGTTFEPKQTERLELNAERSLNFVYEYVASEELPVYYEMCTSEKISVTYYYYYSKLLSDGSLQSATSPSRTINRQTTYYSNTTTARNHAFDLFDSDPFEHEYYGYNSLTIDLKAKVGTTTETFSKEFGLTYYRTLTLIPGA